MIKKAVELVRNWSDSSFNIDAIIPPFILDSADVQQGSPKQVVEFLRELVNKCRHNTESITDASLAVNNKALSKKKRKLANGNGKVVHSTSSASTSTKPDAAHCQLVETTYREIEGLYQNYSALFEWADGPLVCSMKDGSLLLLDEMSLAEDAVLERLNSVLEPSRSLTLAEKGGEGPSCVHESDDTEHLFSSEVRAHEDFCIFATMNPGGDFGKRELSPALRSRFTESWVPPVTHQSDIDLVLERSFSSAVDNDRSTLDGIPQIRCMMLDYFHWFNVDICDDPNSFCNDFKLSLRDVLSWSRFIADVSLKHKIVDQHSAYVHGASLMHLDGLGLGTGVSNQDATTTKNKAKEYLLRQISNIDAGDDVVGFRDELKGIEESMVSTKDCFGINPFTIHTGSEEIPSNLGFNLTAPTTGLNLRRVLRGMQISKPILLEGSPGVGKTSLIQALAKASGHHLVRINLSEQTDISDLMGSDLPYSGEGECDGASSGASFRWCDGVLLKAIKRGDWVLLDELNLASQSVLEGLNSCLDHRASVYIPELGKSFDCPPTFRIFAAQNPLAQGGGRKGLPKSFLNRFTKVYIEALTNDDLFSIVAAQFPSIPSDIVERMIYFNEGVQSDIDSRLYGQTGSPWEFNLRDIFRWCQLLQTDNGGEISSDCAGKYADMLYTQRLRTDHDRSLIEKRFHDHFGSASKKPYPKLEVRENDVLVGTTKLQRFQCTSYWSDIPTQNSEPDIAQSLIRPMEAVACCIHMNWPCLLIGPASSGKSAIIKTLGDVCNVHIETLAMSSSTDVTELIGCFEQTDAMGGMKDILKSMKEIYDDSCLASSKTDVEVLYGVNRHYWHLHQEIMKLENSKSSVTVNKSLVTAINKLVECYESISRINPDFSNSYVDQITSAKQWLSSMKRKSSAPEVQSPFQWMDGILVQAMEKGYWLHLENVNYCPSSVLDRLNPLMEFGGELVMTECGVSDDDTNSKPRVIQPHPNFRLFLSMNPNSHGEVSRAMRNRCIEVCVLPPTPISDEVQTEIGSKIETIDAYTALWDSEVRSQKAGNCMVKAHEKDYQTSAALQEDIHSIKVLKDWGNLFVGLLKRGVANLSLSTSHEILYEMQDSNICEQLSSTAGLLVTGISTRKDLTLNPSAAKIAQLSRFLKVINGRGGRNNLEQFISMIPQSFIFHKPGCKQEKQKLWFQVTCRLLEMIPRSEADHFPSFFDGFCRKTATIIKFTVLIMNDIISKYGPQVQDNSLLPLSGISIGHASRVSHLLEESMTYYTLRSVGNIPPPSDMSVIAVSYYLDKKRIDASVVTCQVTPLLFPLFQAIDMHMSTLQINKSNQGVVLAYEHLLLCRDRLWQCLKRTQYLGTRSKSQVGFDFTGFLIQYCWVKKAFVKLINCFAEEDEAKPIPDSSLHERNMLLSFETIDDSIQESTGGSITSSDVLWKRGGHPRLPSQLDNYDELQHLKDISDTCMLASDELFGFTRMVSSQFSVQLDVKQLIETRHPSLFAQEQFHKELLGALAMTYWASTDETRGVESNNYSTSNAPKVLRKRFMDLEADFVANVHLATIDTSIRTVDNVLDMDAIKIIVGEAMSKTQSSDEFIKNLLIKFGEIQASQIGELWCISEEAAILGRMTETLRKHQCSVCDGIAKEFQSICLEIKSFIRKSLAHTQWPIIDLRPYQTLVWALESESNDDVILHMLRSILPRMFSSYYNHQWCNTYNDLDSISCDLIGPCIWNKEDDETPKHINASVFRHSAKSTLVSSCAGPNRIEMNTNRSAIFRLLRLPPSDTASAYMTMENGDARKAQAKKLMPLFASQGPVKSHAHQIEMIKYLLGCVFDAFEESFGKVHLDIKNLLESTSIKTSDIAALLKHCKNKSLQSYVSMLVIPLIENIQAINESEEESVHQKRHVDLAWVYLGLLRLNMLVPSSPIDPGRKPAAKVEQLDWFLNEVGSNLLSYGLQYGLSHGDFAPESPSTEHLNNLFEYTSKKRTNQEKKIIERPHNAPSFHDLFREIHHFCKTVANPSSVLSLVETIEKDDADSSSFRAQEINWQCSATSFCTRLSTVYSVYEDITIPCANEIRAIQRGLRGLALNQPVSHQTSMLVNTQDELLTYPFGKNNSSFHLTKDSYYQVLKELLSRFGAGGGSRKQDTVIIHRSIQLAALMRLQVNQMMSHHEHVSGDNLSEVNYLFSSLAQLPDITPEDEKASPNNTPSLTEEDKEEKEFREYFPDHGAEFNRIVESSLDDDDDFNDEEEDTNQNEESFNDEADDCKLSDTELSLVVSLHEELFSNDGKRTINDNIRVRAFLSSYEAASRLGHLTEWMKKGQDDNSSLGSYLLALALRSNVNRDMWSSTVSSDSTIRDFHNDPFPSESIKADLPLRNLLIRIGQLLRAFPGHAVLVSLGQVVERVRKLDIQAVALGKVMTGLEVILRRAQDYEQHASLHVTLGKPLKDISALVTSWRKLELQSWSHLLTIRENRRSIRAKRHWPRVYSLIHKSKGSGDESNCSSSTSATRKHLATPSWVWKGHPKLSASLGTSVDTKNLGDLAKVLDTFILTSNIAEFSARLDLIQSFANEIQNECEVDGKEEERFHLARLLQSLCNYYSRFVPLLIQTKAKLRDPIEKRLKDEVKLAKWDEQSYYSLVSLNKDRMPGVCSNSFISLTFLFSSSFEILSYFRPSQARKIIAS